MPSATAYLANIVRLLFMHINIPIPTPTVVVNSLPTLVALTTYLLATLNYNRDLGTRQYNDGETYDFIIVGAGSAGSVLANRLSAISKLKVLVLEYGGSPLEVNDIPMLALFNLHYNETDWMYTTTPQKDVARATVNNSILYTRGKSLGGSSNLNLMIYMRGNPKDFDLWSTLTGDTQWSWRNVLKYFKKSENYLGNYPDPTYHGKGGPLTVSKHSYHVLEEEWKDAGREMGYPNSDPNAYQTSTFSTMDFTIKNGRRASTYHAFLQEAIDRDNVMVKHYARVLKINFNSNKEAVGVTYIKNDKTYTSRARREVILSAGAIGSPHLLMLSGIGPSDQLRQFGIPIIRANDGVGSNLQDHVLTQIGPFVLNDSVSFIAERNLTAISALDYVLDKTGPVSYNFISSIGLFSTENSADNSWPNICCFQIPVGLDDSMSSTMENVYGLREGVVTEYFDGAVGKDASFVLVNLGRPKSSGSVRLASSNPYDQPLIDPNYYSDSDDMAQMVKALKFVVRFYETTQAWQKYNATLWSKAFPGCESTVFKSNEYFECYIRQFTSTTWHPACTAKMGKTSDPTAVVDSNLRVIGVKRLRVIDASVMPRITNANLNAPSIMIGEKGADIVLKYWGF